MNSGCMLSAHSGIEIGSGCMFGPGVKIFDNNHRFNAEHGVTCELKSAPIKIGNNCWLASDVVVLRGVTIGDGCAIGAGCIITQDVPAGTLVQQKQQLIFEKIR